MKIRRISDGKIFEVRKYVNGFGEESVWCDDWYGHHMIHRDCEFVDTYTAEDMEKFSHWYNRKVSVIGESELHLFGARPFRDIIDYWNRKGGQNETE